MTATADQLYADLYSALFWATIEPDRYARPSSPGQMPLFRDEPEASASTQSREMIPRPTAATAATRKLPFPPNHVIAEVRDQQGQLLGHELEPHEGTPESIRQANSRLRARLDDLHPTWSNVMTRTGATNQQAHPQWVVSPNSRNVYEAGTPEARDLMGLTSEPEAPRPRIGQRPAQYAATQQPQSPWTATAYQGTGRAEQGSVYKHGPGAVFQGASYYAFSPEHAKRYGPEVTEHQVTLQRPRHVTNDQQWHELAAEAGVKPSLNMGSLDPGAIRQAATAMQQHLVARGHDGLVIQGVDRTKWPSRIFGHDQVVKFQPPTSDQYAAKQPTVLYRGEGRNIGYSAVPGVEWWSLDPEQAAHYGTVRQANLHPGAKVLHLEDQRGHDPQGIEELQTLAATRGIEFDPEEFQSMTGEEYFGQRGHPHELMNAIRDHGYHAVHTSNIEGPATMVLDQGAFTGPKATQPA